MPPINATFDWSKKNRFPITPDISVQIRNKSTCFVLSAFFRRSFGSALFKIAISNIPEKSQPTALERGILLSNGTEAQIGRAHV